MSRLEDIPQPENAFYVLVTGANSGLGLGIGTRLIDEFLATHPETESLVLIITTRDQRKGDATIEKLQEHLRKLCHKAERRVPGASKVLQRRVHFRQERLDLLNLISIQKLSKRLRETTPKLNAIICNAGIGGWTHINYPYAIWCILTDLKSAVTFAPFKVAGRGWLTKPQIPLSGDGKKAEEPQLGEVFCANFFGHYLLGHYLAPLLAKHAESEQTRGRLIWTTSLDALGEFLDMGDIQGIGSDHPYEVSKRVTDLIAITSTFPSNTPLVNKYLDYEKPPPNTTKPRMYVSHPGICGTSIVALPLILEYAMVFVFYVARWFGSQWHPVSVEKGACAAVWLALADQRMLDEMERREGVGKWGSATDWWGNERVERTEVEGWGWGGKLGERPRKGRAPFAKDLTEEGKQKFEADGRKLWEETERLRVDWERRLDEAGVGVKME